jgi:hypothetical protein
MLQRSTHPHPEPGAPGGTWHLLIESADPVFSVADFSAYREAGFEVTLCQGPSESPVECPLVRAEPCPFADAADVVLFDLGPNEQERLEVLAALRASRHDLPILVRSPDPRLTALVGCETVSRTTSVPGQVTSLREAVLRPTRTPASTS